MTRPIPRVALVCALVAAGALTSCSSGDSDRLTIYSGRTRELVEPLLEDFADETGIDIDVKYDDSANLAVLINTEGDKSPADVFLSQSPGAIGYVDGEGNLRPLPAKVLDQVPERFRANDGDWVGLSGRVRVIVYDADRTDESEVPDSVFDLTAPEFDGRVGVAPTNGSFQDFISTMRALVGDDETLAWLEGLVANGVRTYPNNIAIREAVERGEIDFGLVNHYYNEQAKAEDPDTSTENHFMPGEDPGSMILTTAVGVLSTAGDQEDEAEEFVEFLLSREAQEYFATETLEYPLAAGGAARGRSSRARFTRGAGRRPVGSRWGTRTHARADPRERTRGDVTAATTTVLPAPPRAERAPRAPIGLVAASVVVAAAFALPLAYLAWHSLGLGEQLFDVLAAEDFGAPLRRTLVLGIAVAASATALGTSLAWLVTRTDLPGRRAWRVVVPLPLVIPSFVGAFTLIAAFAPGGLVETFLGFDHLPRVEGFGFAALVLALLTYPYVYLPVAARLRALPASLEESARSLGRSPRQVFATIVVPQCTGAMWAGALLVFLYTLSEFGAVQLLHYDTLTRAIYASWLFDRDVALSLSFVLALVALAVVALERMLARRRVQTEAVAPAASAVQHRLGPWRIPALLYVAGVVGISVVVPVLVLVHWTWRGIAGNAELHAADLVDPALTTAWLGLTAAGIAITVLLPVAFLTTRHRSRTGEASNALIVAGFALPGLVLALSIVFFVIGSPFSDYVYQSYGLLLFAYAVHFGAQSLRSSQVAVGGVPRRVEDAARSLGANPVRRLFTVQLPLMRPGVLAGGGLVLLSTMKELPATLVLSPPGTDTLATRIWGSTQDGFFAQAGLAALVLLALSAVLTYALTIRAAGTA